MRLAALSAKPRAPKSSAKGTKHRPFTRRLTGVLPKLEVGESDHPLERQADAIANFVMRAPPAQPTPTPAPSSPSIANGAPRSALPQPAKTDVEFEDEALDEEPLEQLTFTSFDGGLIPISEASVQRSCASCSNKEEEELRRSVDDIHRKCTSCEVEEALQRRACASCEDESEQLLRACEDEGIGARGGELRSDFETRLRVRLSGGRPLRASARSFLESRLGVELPDVRIHDDPAAAALSRGIRARAFSYHQHIFFASGAFQPHTRGGMHLLAHEVAHTLQARGLAGEAGARQLRRAPDPHGLSLDPDGEMTRKEEVELSRSSPGKLTYTKSPTAFSLFNFAINESQLKPEHEQALGEISEMLSYIPKGALNVRLVGRSSAPGSNKTNDRLSRRRVQAVAKQLENYGGKVTITWVGEDRPIGDDMTVEGRSRNRAVDIQLWQVRPVGPAPGPGPTPGPAPEPDPIPGPPPEPAPDPDPQPPPEPTPEPKPIIDPPIIDPPIIDEPSRCERWPMICDAFDINGPDFEDLLLLAAAAATAAALWAAWQALKGLSIPAWSTCALVPQLCSVGPPPWDPGPDPKDPDPKDPDEDKKKKRRPWVTFSRVENFGHTPNRLTLDVPTRVDAIITDWDSLEPDEYIEVYVDGSGTKRGSALIEGQAEIALEAGPTANFLVSGHAQTQFAINTPGRQSLRLMAFIRKWGNPQSNFAGQSDPFMVSANPLGIQFNSSRMFGLGDIPTLAGGTTLGLEATGAIESDTGDHSNSHLGHVDFIEEIRQINGKKDIDIDAQEEPGPADIPVLTDYHSINVEFANSPDIRTRLPKYGEERKLIAHQLFRYENQRLNEFGIIPLSGFYVEYILKHNAARSNETRSCVDFSVRKRGLKVALGGDEAAAGSVIGGELSGTIEVPCPETEEKKKKKKKEDPPDPPPPDPAPTPDPTPTPTPTPQDHRTQEQKNLADGFYDPYLVRLGPNEVMIAEGYALDNSNEGKPESFTLVGKFSDGTPVIGESLVDVEIVRPKTILGTGGWARLLVVHTSKFKTPYGSGDVSVPSEWRAGKKVTVPDIQEIWPDIDPERD